MVGMEDAYILVPTPIPLNKIMNTLWFARITTLQYDHDVVVQFTLDKALREEDAKTQAIQYINPDYQHKYVVRVVERVCDTLDTVYFEPV